MEILAPAGSKESFITAIKAGADAVYVGLKDFNARKNADNFNFYDLQVLTDYAHSKNVKVFVALNILIKHEEFNNAVRFVANIQKIGVDAVIIQDLGLAKIIAGYFPDLNMHASTQLACHNSNGARFLANFGFKRVVLARELSFSEIKSITNSVKNIEYEMFVHGALCFSISGMCLFSSLIGGFSGNRGLCTQPCRRIWTNDNGQRGYLFSPKDLELVKYLKDIEKTGIKSLKIEGRMRSAEYVYNATSIYKKGVLIEDYAREKSSCLFSGRDEKLFEPEKPQCLGKKIGEFPDFSKAKIGDRLRIVNPKTDRNFVFKFGSEMSKIEGFEKGNPIFLAGSSAFDEKILKKEIDAIFMNNKKKELQVEVANNYTNLIARVWEKKENQKEKLWIKIDDVKWLDYLKNIDCKIIFSVNKNNMQNCSLDENIVVELPPFIAERELFDFKRFCEDKKEIVLNNIGHFGIAPNESQKIAGNFLYVWNAYSAKCLKDLGVEKYFVSWEDDILNIFRLASSNLKHYLIVNLFGKPVVVRSKMLPKDCDYNKIISDKNDIEISHLKEGNLSILVSEKPMMIFNAKNKLQKLGIENFCIDLSFIKPDKQFLDNLLLFYRESKNFEDSIKFNFKRGVK